MRVSKRRDKPRELLLEMMSILLERQARIRMDRTPETLVMEVEIPVVIIMGAVETATRIITSL